MTEDEQHALSKKYLALPVYLVPLPGGRWALLSGFERSFVAAGTFPELEAHVPSLTPTAEKPLWHKPKPRKKKVGASELAALLKGVKK